MICIDWLIFMSLQDDSSQLHWFIVFEFKIIQEVAFECQVFLVYKGNRYLRSIYSLRKRERLNLKKLTRERDILETFIHLFQRT